MEIQREAIIEIVGTQYEDRASNHQSLFLHQDLMLKHQSDNPHDHNAVLLLTEDGKELGFLPKGYASLYAPAIDSGKYSFSVEILKAEPDPERPILIVKIISELASRNEKDIESDILGFVQNIVNGYAQSTKEYLTFIYSETVNVDELLSTLDKVRFMQKLLSCSNDIIESHTIKPNSDKFTPLNKESLIKYLSELKMDISCVLKKIQKTYNESLDIDDEEEYHRVQSKIRDRRKKFRQYDGFLISLLDIVSTYVNITTQIHSNISDDNCTKTENLVHEEEKVAVTSEFDDIESAPNVITKSTLENNMSDNPQLTEQAFFDWLVSEGGVSDSTAKQYISNIHSVEKLYQTLFGIKKNILGASSADNVKPMIDMLIHRSEYIDANNRRHNSFGISLSKFTQFADMSVAELKSTSDKKNYHPPVSTQPYVVKTVNFEDPHNCTYYKPCSFILNELKYSARNWCELYTKFLVLLYNDNTYYEIIKNLNGKSLYGRRIDFADKTLVNELRRPLCVSDDFFAEGNLSAIDIIKHIKCLMKHCSIDDEHMIIEYSTQDKGNEMVLSDSDNSDETTAFMQFNTSSTAEQKTENDNEKEMISADFPKSSSYIINEEKIDRNSFINWLTSVFDLAPATAQSYYSSITVSERIAQEQNLKSQRLLSAQSYTEARETFDELLKCDAFIKMNDASHNSLTAGIRKLISYMLTKSVTPIPSQETTEREQLSISENTAPTSASFTPDTTKLFALKDAVIELLLTDAPEITKYHEHKNGISSNNLRELIKEYYGKTISLFEISKLLMLDKTFRSVGKGCYIVNESAIPHKEAELEFVEKDEPIENADESIYSAVIHEELTIDDIVNTDTDKESIIESIIEVIEENYNNLQYEDGFGVYDVKYLLSQKGHTNVSEDEIKALMSYCPELREIEDGYYTLYDNGNSTETFVEMPDIAEDNTEDIETKTVKTQIVEAALNKPSETNIDTRCIVLRLNENLIRAYDYSDALNKICEFSINCEPFKMARIAGQDIQLNGNRVFYRKSVPVDGYNKLSNGSQVIAISSLSDLQAITAAVKKYCQIDDDMITIISR